MESGLSADKNVEQLSEEELHCVLKQLIDHNLPETEKCPLVQRLKAEEKNNNNSYSSLLQPTSGHRTGGSSGSARSSVKNLRSRPHVLTATKENAESAERSQRQSEHHSQSHQHANHGAQSSHPREKHHHHQQPVNYAQSESVHELTSNTQQPQHNHNHHCDDGENWRAAISNSNTEIVAGSSHNRGGGNGNRKPSRANSFTMPSPSDNNSSKGDSSLKILDHQPQHHHHQQRLTTNTTANGSEVSAEMFPGANKQQTRDSGSRSLSNLQQQQQHQLQQPHKAASTTLVNSATPPHSSYSNSSHYSPCDTSADQLLHLSSDSLSSTTTNTITSHSNFSSVHLDRISSLVDSISTESETSGCTTTNYPRLLTDGRGLNKSNNSQSLTVQEEDEEQPQFGEMKNLHSHATFIEYRSPQNNSPKKKEDPSCNGNNNDYDNNNNNDHAVDQPIEMAMLTNSKSEEGLGFHQNYNALSTLNSAMPLQPSAPFYNNTFGQNQNNPANGSRIEKIKTRRQIRKEKAEKNVKKPESYEGYFGFIQDVSLLEKIVTNKSTMSDAMALLEETKGKSKKLENEPGKRPKRNKIKANNDEDKGGVALAGSATNGSSNNNNNNRRSSSNSKVPLSSSTSNSSSDDGQDEDERIMYYSRSKKSNSLMPTSTTSNSNTPPEDDNLYTVSDSEMAEKGFVTPKNKYFKKKKLQQQQQQSTFQHGHDGGGSSNNGTQHNSSNHSRHSSNKNLPFNSNANGVHNLGRGYESEREYSFNLCFNTNTFSSHSLSSSMLAIGNSRKNVDKKPACNLSPPNSQDMPPLSPAPDDLLDSVFFPTPCDAVEESGPKMPSYAAIAKSSGQPTTNASKIVTTPNPVNTNSNSCNSNNTIQSVASAPVETANCVNGDKLSFGFFEDSEISMIHESDFCPLDPSLYNPKVLKLSSADAPTTNNTATVTTSITTTTTTSPSIVVEANNNRNKPSKPSKSSKPNASAVIVAPKPFISCVNELSNYQFIDDVHSDSYNYSDVIKYVYNAWKNRDTQTLISTLEGR